MLKIPIKLRHVSVLKGPSSGSTQALLKLPLCTINIYAYVGDVGVCIRH